MKDIVKRIVSEGFRKLKKNITDTRLPGKGNNDATI